MTEEDAVLENKSVRQKIDSKGRFVKGMTPWNKGKKTGHIPWNKGKVGIYSPEYIKKLSDSHKGKISHNMPHYEETKRKLSEINRGKRPTEEARRKMSEYQRNRPPATPETRRKISLAKTGNKGRSGIPMSEEQKRRLIQFNTGRKATLQARINMSMAQAKRIMQVKDTSIEKIIQQKLVDMKIQFLRQKCFRIRDFNHMVDFFIQPNICIECDGEYWHSRMITPNRTCIRIQRDFIIDVELEKKGMRVIRLWEYDIRNNLDWCLGLIVSYINMGLLEVKVKESH
jgi:very-short-patch-repair endonuclease